MSTNILCSHRAEKIRTHLSHVLSLLVIFLLLSVTAVWTGNLFGKPFAENEQSKQSVVSLTEPTAQQLQDLGIDKTTTQLALIDSAAWSVTSLRGENLGMLISTKLYAADIKGFAGATPLYIYVDKNGGIRQIVAQDNADTPNFFNKAFTALKGKWIGKNMNEAATMQVDAVSGATFSSNAIIKNVQRSMSVYASQQNGDRVAPAIGWGRTVAVAMVLLLGCLISVYFRGNKPLRIFQQLLNVVVLGFWCGQFLSLSLLRGWIANGVDVVTSLPTLMVLTVAVVMPFFKRKHHYCSLVCPLGSLQELASYLPIPKIHCSAKVYKAMTRIRLWAFALLMLLLWTGIGGFLLDFEPFTAFMLHTASLSVLVLAAVIVVASMFIPNVWCKSLCPMGMTLNLSEK